jgi:AraC-like DNA-binding protein
MLKKNIYQPVEIVVEECCQCPSTGHEHTYFELVFVADGSGLQCINNNKYNYSKGCLFLITPDDCHSFDIHTKTKFLYIRFNNTYLKSNILQEENKKRLEYILHNANHQPGCIMRNQHDRELIISLANYIIEQYNSKDIYSSDIIYSLINSIIAIVARNIALDLPARICSCTETKTLDIIQYIQTNIFNPEKLRADEISAHFGISESYLGRYFKKHTGETMQDFIVNYKLRLIETRLTRSNMRINEIAHTMGFTDESHLTKVFKKHHKVTPSDYRRGVRK